MNIENQNTLRYQIATVQETGTGIQRMVAREALKHDDIRLFLQSVIKSESATGLVVDLATPNGLSQFWEEHAGEIESMRVEIEIFFGIPTPINTRELEERFAWYTFAESANRIWQDLRKKA